MDKRKAIVIAVVLFLLIGLGTFVFANPSEERLDGNDTGITDNGNNNEVDGENTDGEEETEQPAEETEDDDVISVIDDGNDNTGNGNSGNGNSGSSNNNNNNGNGNNNENNNNNNNNNNNGGSTEEDNSAYLAALAALEKAEASYLQGDLDAANDLISDLADGSDKQGLVDRANALQHVIDVETLVKNLQNQVNAAENMDNVNSARDYRANEDIINKVNNLADSSKKEELKGILSEVAVILDDTTAPGIRGIDNGGVYKEAILEIVEENLHTAEIRKENGRWEDFTSGYKVSESGTYYVKIIDKAYNRLEISFTIDADAPVYKELGIVNITHYIENKDNGLNSDLKIANIGDTLRVMVRFDEVLAKNPMIKIGDMEAKEMHLDSAWTNYYYWADVTLTPEMNLSDGDIDFTITQYADSIGNEGIELTKEQLNHTLYTGVKLDTTLPVLNFSNGKIVSEYTVEVTEENFDYMTVQHFDGTPLETITEKTYVISGEGDNVRYNIKVYDKAGNVSEYRDIYLDNVKPEITGTATNGKSEVSLTNNGTYKKVTLNISDGSLKKVVLVKEDGSEEVLQEFDDNYTNEKVVYEGTFGDEETFGDEGTYTIKGVDRNNQEVSITFTIDKTAPKRSAANILEYNADNNLGTYYVKTGDTIHAYVSFDEPLAENPTIVFVNDGKEYAATRVDQLLPDALTGKYIYNAYYEVNETDMIDGEVTFKVTNIKDKAGNTTEVTEVTNGHHVYIDRESPKMDLSKISSTFEVGVDTYVYPQPGVVTDNVDGNISFGEVHMQWFKKTADGEKEETTCFGGDNWNTGLTNCDLGTYIVTYRVSDKAGNQAYVKKEIILQDTTPSVIKPDREDVTNFVQGEDIYTETGTASDNYDNIDFSDINIDYYLKDNDGNETKQPEFKLGSDLSDIPAGIYRIHYWYSDSAGNKSELSKIFNLKNMQAIEKVLDLVDDAKKVMNDSSIDKTLQQHAIDYALQEANKLPNFEEKLLFITELNELQSVMNNNKKYEEILGYYNKINEYLIAKDYTSAQKYIDIVKQQLPNLQNYETEKQNILTGVNNFQATINNNKKYEEILDYYNKISEYLIVGDYESAQKYIDIVKQQLPNLQNYETEKQNISNKIEEFQKQLNSLKQA